MENERKHDINLFKRDNKVEIKSGCCNKLIGAHGIIIGYSSLYQCEALYIVYFPEWSRPEGVSSFVNIESYHIEKLSDYYWDDK